ncbi:tripartite tricarboxylate transporter TctB family protein [Salinicola acroporae]|uniref:DUF1468 domain-containing protein n=1 Tax=Salinicola acroporae TaxID=1541440 RepID=A0ABT6I9B1_9GAMM|nr:tripartite tricarboxylate transporter TctB family protein [Salinicola acroporae]MDH4573974.1 hypothetical protein [Salinicola acroporae]
MSLKRFATDGRLVVPCALAIITLIYLVDALQLGPPMRNGNMTPSFFPIVISVVTLAALAVAIAQAYRSLCRPSESEEAEPQGVSSKAIVVALITAAYLFAFDLIGYVISTLAYVFLMTLVFGGRQGLIAKLVGTVIITALGFALFELVFNVRLPTLWSQ